MQEEKQVWGKFDEFTFGCTEFECLWAVQNGEGEVQEEMFSRQKLWREAGTGDVNLWVMRTDQLNQ